MPARRTSKPRVWTNREKYVLRVNFFRPAAWLARKLDRSVSAIHNKRNELDVRKFPTTDLVRVTTTLTKMQKLVIDDMSRRTGLSRAHLVRDAISHYFDHLEETNE